MLRMAVLFAAFLARQATAVEFALELVPGWNLVSVPIAPDDSRPDVVFQGTIEGTVWEYAPDLGYYVEAEEIQPGRGYWVYAPALPDRAEDRLPPLTVTGSNVRGETVPLSTGWNLLGPISYEPYAALPAPLKLESGARGQTGPVWAWRDNRYYETDSLPCGAGAWVRSPEAGIVRVSPNPVFAGAVMAYSPEVGEARAHWPDATDDRTVPEQMLYRVYAATARRTGLVDDANLVQTVVGATQAELSGLTPGATYGIVVVAEDGAGNRNYFNRTVLAVPVMEVANVMAKTPRDIAAEGIEVAGVSPDGAVVTVASAGDLAVDDLIVFDNPNGQGLKRIVAVDPTRDGVELTTVDACLAEAVDTGVVCSSLVVDDMNGLVPTGATRDGALVYRDPAGAFQLTRQCGDGQGASRDEVGVIEGRYEGEADLGSGLNVGYGIGFKPTIDTEARFEWLSLKYCRIVATGEFSLDAWAKYELAGELSFNPKKKLFGVSHTFHYWVTPLYVWQEVGLDFYAEMEVTAAGALNMEAVYSAAKMVQIGVEYDDGAWSTITSDGFTQSVTFDVQAEGMLLATVKIYPVLRTKFYSSLAASLYVEPTLQLDSHMRFLPLPAELTKFDVDFLVNSHVEAGFDIFDWGKTWTSPTWTMLDVPIFSLPKVQFASPPGTVGTDQPTAFTLAVTDGERNPVAAAGIEWWVEAASARRGVLPTIVPAADRLSATVTAAEPGEYRLWASVCGSGSLAPLAPLGKRYASTTFVVQDPHTVIFALGAHGTWTGGGALVQEVTHGDAAVEPEFDIAVGWEFTGWDAEYEIVTGDLTVTALYRAQPPPPAAEFALIPGGTNSGTDPDFGAYSLTVSAFYMGRTEVTKAKWDAVRAWGLANGYTDLPAGAGQGQDHPVHSVSWYDVVKWCNARSQMEGRAPCYTVSGSVYKTGESDSVAYAASASGYRLPTDTEWEYAARGGLSGKRFPWGDTITHSQANYVSYSVFPYDVSPTRGYHPDYFVSSHATFTSPAGSFAANGYGLHDMTGNVWDWCWDWHPVSVGSSRAVHGGGWGYRADYCRVGRRVWVPPAWRASWYGFRVCSAAPVQ